jgi:chemotaxis protein methyltransferase CheR
VDIDRASLEELSALLLERAGLRLHADNYAHLRHAVEARLVERNLTDVRTYVRALRHAEGDAELRALLPFVTVGKTDFFRDDRQFSALETDLLPRALANARRDGRRLMIWSAGCATGEEPYSLAMVLAELGARPFETTIWATDINPEALDKARSGWFAPRRMSGVSDGRRVRFFVSEGTGYRVRPGVRELVRFEHQNLAEAAWRTAPRGGFDLVLCRNVIIYFDLPTIRRVLDNFHDALRPDGLLLLGYSESLYKVHARFEMIDLRGGAFGYRPISGFTASRTDLRAIVPPKPIVLPRPLPPPPAPVPDVPVKNDPVAEAVVRIEQGEFTEAARLLDETVERSPHRLDAVLTLANVAGLLGEWRKARTLLEGALARDPVSTDAHVFLALAAFQQGHLEDARRELSRALFLEPTLAIAHYLLAQTLEKAKDPTGARRSYRNAIAQLRHPQRKLAGHYPDLPDGDVVARASRYALASLEESQRA